MRLQKITASLNQASTWLITNQTLLQRNPKHLSIRTYLRNLSGRRNKLNTQPFVMRKQSLIDLLAY